MLRKIILVILSFCLIFSICAVAETIDDSGTSQRGNMPSRGSKPASSEGRMPQGDFDMSQLPQGDFDMSQLPQGGFDPSQFFQGGSSDSEGSETQGSRPNNRNNQFGGQMGDMSNFFGNMQGSGFTQQEPEKMTFSGFIKTYSTPVISIVLLALAYVFVLVYKRKKY